MSGHDRFTRADRLLDAVLDLPAAERRGFLDRECGDDAELRELVERLLLGAADTPTGELETGGALEAAPGALSDGAVPPLEQATLLDRYRIRREAGRGGMGVVYEALDEKLERAVAIKMLPVRSIDDRTRERFLREARAAAALNHPNIVAIHDAGEADGRPYLVMEYVPGRSLHERPPGSLAEAIGIARLVCDALEHAHDRGLVHRDLKPGNVLVHREDDQLIVKLTDMGIALARGAARVTQTGAITGTPTYMAPEQALGKQVDGRADLYSLGVMLYEWVAGRPPFEGDDALAIVSQHIHAPVVPPRTYRPDLPAGLEPILLRLLAKTPDGRFASAAEARAALDAVGTERADTATMERVTIDGLTRGRLVGRQRELERLQQIWQAANDGRSHMALISGEPGVGKTRLAYEITATAQLDGALALTGGCYEHEATTAYLPFIEAFRRLVHERSDDELHAALGDSAVELARLAPEIESRLGPFGERPSLSPQEERLRLFDHVARFLGRLAAPRGLLFFIDDLQWADHGSLALLHYLMRQLVHERVLFVGTYREVELDRTHALSKTLVDWNRERLATRVRLERLDRDATGRMISTLLGQQEVSAEFVVSLHAETEGNPFFVEEIVKAMIAEGELVHEGCRWKRCHGGDFVLPQSVKSAIGSRLERISAPCAEALRTAAVLGKVFDFDELVSIARRGDDELLDALDEAVNAQLIVASGGESFAFTHDKIREVLYEELNPVRRRRLHAKIAEGLEQLQQRGAPVAVEDLAYHFVQCGDYERGLLYTDRAAGSALRVFAWDEALELLGRARECAEALEREQEIARIDEAMGDTAWASGDVAGAAEHYERALAAVDDPQHRADLRGKAGEVYVTAGDSRGLRHVRAALAEPDAGSRPRETAHALMVEARYLHIEGKLKEAAEVYGRAIELAEPLDVPALLVRMLSFQAGTYQHLAEFDRSDGISRRCIEIGEQRNLPDGILLGCEFLSENGFYRGWWDDCVRYGEREESLALEVHAGERYAWSHFRALALHQVGRLTEAERLFVRAIEETGRSGDRRLGLFMRMGHAICLADTGRIEKALEIADAALREADEAKLTSHRLVGREYLGYVLRRLGRFEEAARQARIALELWRSTGSKGAFMIQGAGFAESLVRWGDVDEARPVLEAHRELAEGTRAGHRVGQNLRVRGLLASREGRARDALALLEQAVVELDTCNSRIELAHALRDRAEVLRELHRPEDARADLARAGQILAACGAA